MILGKSKSTLVMDALEGKTSFEAPSQSKALPRSDSDFNKFFSVQSDAELFLRGPKSTI